MRIILLKLLLLALALLTPHFSNAEWILVKEDDDKSVYYDPTRTLRNDLYVQVWVLANWGVVQTTKNAKSYQSVLSLQQYACSENKFIALSHNLFEKPDGTGTLVYKTSDQAWKYVLPNGDYQDEVFKLVCLKK
ncbi:MAG: surface-adhesin E family protein [Betaproteobacteria bacterium]|jgi:hypothetical protein